MVNVMKKIRQNGFTLIEVLVVIVIISILAAILIPLSGKARESALRRRADTEMQSIKVAVMQFYTDHRYMPWPTEPGDPQVGSDMWTMATDDSQVPMMALLTGANPMQKIYLQIPEKSRRKADEEGENIPLRFLDPWGGYYLIGMDRNIDGSVTVQGTGVEGWDGRIVMEKVLVFSAGNGEPRKTFDIVDLAP